MSETTQLVRGLPRLTAALQDPKPMAPATVSRGVARVGIAVCHAEPVAGGMGHT